MRSSTPDQALVPEAPARPARPAAVLRKVPIIGVISVPWIATFAMLSTGRIWANGDNLIQSYPLRVLTGVDIRHGHLPLWDPFIWSGTPLLAGFNAGAAYPPTLLFAVLPPHVAWVINQALPFSVAAAGIYVLLRTRERSELASVLAAASFSLGGFMIAQNVHLDLLEGASWLPWAFVAIDRIAGTRRTPQARKATERTWPWVLLLAASTGLMILAGAPEAPLDSVVPLCIYAGWSALRSRRPAPSVLGACALGGLGGLWLSVAQWLPGLMFQLHSQRAPITYGYFTSGSLRPVLSILSFAPYVLGGTRSSVLGYPSPVNLVEVASYTGILTMVGTFALAARWRHREAREWRIWFVILIAGVLLAWGRYAPLGILMYHVPGYDKQRLLSRNLLVVDLAACVLFAYWCDSIIFNVTRQLRDPGRRRMAQSADAPAPSASSAQSLQKPPGEPPGGLLEKRLSLVPVAIALATYLAFLAFGPVIEKLLGVMTTAPSRSSLVHLDVGMLPWVAVVTAAGILALRGWSAPKRTVAAIMSILVLLDLSIFSLDMVAFPRPKSASNATAAAGATLARAAGAGRVAIYDPSRSHFSDLLSLSSPDLNILRRMQSVQGYGAIVSASYDQSTRSHTLLNLWPAGLKGTTFDKLDLTTLLSPRFYFIRRHIPTPPTQPAPAPGALPQFPPAPTSFAMTPGTAFTWYFGEPLHVVDLSLPLISAQRQGSAPAHAYPAARDRTSHVPASGAYLRLGLIIAQGGSSPAHQRTTIRWVTTSEHVVPGGSISVRPPGGAAAVGLVALATARPAQRVPSPGGGTSSEPPRGSGTSNGLATVTVGVAKVTARDGTGYFLDGELQGFIKPVHWTYVGTDGPFAMFHNTRARGRAWVLTATGSPMPAGHATVVSQRPWGTTTIDVTSPTAGKLIWSEAYATGWHADVYNQAKNRTRTAQIAVHRHGLLQEVAVQAGEHTVTFRYQAPGDGPSIAASLAAAASGAAVAASGGAIELRRRKSRARPRSRRQ